MDLGYRGLGHRRDRLADQLAAANIGAVILGDQQIDRRYEEERESRSDRHAGHQHQPDAVARGGPRPGHEREREVTAHRGHAGHHDRPKAGDGGFLDGLELGMAGLALELVGELDDQDAILRDQAHPSVTRPTWE